MLFNSSQFLLFLPAVMVGYFLLPHKLRWLFVLICSYYFYMCWRVEYILIIAASTLIDYTVVRLMDNVGGGKRRALLAVSLTMNLGLLFFYKYFDFVMASGNAISQAAGGGEPFPILKLLLPVGISFYSFQSMAYAIDVYRKTTTPEKHLGYFAMFVAYWPQLVAGPIERSRHMLPQYRKHFGFDYDRTVHALCRIAYGFFKKVVVADRLAVYVNEVYQHPQDFGTFPVLIGSVFFAIQIYCDFSGYTDIAIGSAQIMGVELSENFNRPYLSKSITEFWRRWHISLSSWFRDYVYIPLGGSRVLKWRMYYNLFITFLVSGLWHGANWTFVIWGGLHGVYLIVERLTEGGRLKLRTALRLDKVPRVSAILSVSITFTLVVIGWVFFRAKSLDEAFAVFGKVVHPDFNLNLSALMGYQGPFNFAVSLLAIGLLVASYWLPGNMKVRRSFLFLVAVFLVVLLFGKGGNNDFIYFQF
jgi:alginate O-acetyltransferase complex protein AlgI